MGTAIYQHVSPFCNRTVELTGRFIYVREEKSGLGAVLPLKGRAQAYEFAAEQVDKVTIYYQSKRMARLARRLGLNWSREDDTEANQCPRLSIVFRDARRKRRLIIDGTGIYRLEISDVYHEKGRRATGWAGLALFANAVAAIIGDRRVVRKRWTLY